MSVFRTVGKISEGSYKEKGSKFLAFAVPCKTEEEAKNHLTNWRKEHHLAVHVCYAFRFGSDKKHFRASDDGEPSNSAGPPILGQIQSFDLTNILVAVVRYYGGTNLGVGGLINAYRTAAKEALENAEIIESEDQKEIRVLFKYEQMPIVMKVVKSHNCKISEQLFEQNCVLKISFPISNVVLLAQLKQIGGVETIEMQIVS
jgi:uncharacterized YigZ family protein